MTAGVTILVGQRSALFENLPFSAEMLRESEANFKKCTVLVQKPSAKRQFQIVSSVRGVGRAVNRK